MRDERVLPGRGRSTDPCDRRSNVSALDRAELERRLLEATATLASLPRGTVAYRDAQNTVHHLQRLVMVTEELPPTMDPRNIRPRR